MLNFADLRVKVVNSSKNKKSIKQILRLCTRSGLINPNVLAAFEMLKSRPNKYCFECR